MEKKGDFLKALFVSRDKEGSREVLELLRQRFSGMDVVFTSGRANAIDILAHDASFKIIMIESGPVDLAEEIQNFVGEAQIVSVGDKKSIQQESFQKVVAQCLEKNKHEEDHAVFKGDPNN